MYHWAIELLDTRLPITVWKEIQKLSSDEVSVLVNDMRHHQVLLAAVPDGRLTLSECMYATQGNYLCGILPIKEDARNTANPLRFILPYNVSQTWIKNYNYPDNNGITFHSDHLSTSPITEILT